MTRSVDARIPVTILTGFLGAGKTTLLNRILREPHGHRIAVIENEFGEAGIDNEILLQERDEQIVEMNNGCICCTVRGDLVRILGSLSDKRCRGELDFSRVVIETTGLADPAPVAQTFFVEEAIVRDYTIDAIITVVDARHGPQQLDEHHEAQEQVGFADRILLSKTDLVPEPEVQALVARLKTMNPRAPVKPAHFGQADVADILDIRGFDLDAILGIDPQFLDNVDHEHDDDVGSFVYRDARPFDLQKLETFFGLLLQTFGADMLRYKGVLNIEGRDRRIIFQGVHMLMSADDGKPWAGGEARSSVMVFIGRKLPRVLFEKGLAMCVAGEDADPAQALAG
ncbi:MAG: GTP-binding protein [Burkholderiales bacterium]|jgi:G3E family GTPase|nr:GTP-binding protein [Burkholderiales bacterium]